MGPPEIWVSIFFGGYFFGTVFYIQIQFDPEYAQRNNRDWHYMVLLVTLPAVVGGSYQLRPKEFFLRVFYAFILIIPIPIVVVINTFFYNFMKVQFYQNQISTVFEINERDFRRAGSQDVLNEISNDVTVCT